jgi:Putative phage tail protein
MSRVIYQRDPVSRRRELGACKAGQSIAELAPDWSMPFVAVRNGQYYARAEWPVTSMQEGDTLIFAALPQGPAAAVFSFFVADAAASYLATEIAWASIATAGGLSTFNAAYGLAYGAAFFATSSLVSAAIGVSGQTSTQQMQDASAASPTYSIGAQSNSARVNQPIPDHYGQVLRYPDLLTSPYSEYRTTDNADGDQFLIQSFMLGQGEYQIDGVYIDDTPIDNYADVTYGFVGPGASLPTDQLVYTNPEVSSNELNTSEAVQIIVVPEGRTATRLDVDLILPRGLGYSNSSGGLDAREVRLKIETRAVGGSTWTALTGPSYSDWSAWAHYEWRSDTSLPSNTSTEEYQAGGYDTESGLYSVQHRTRTCYADQWCITGATITPQRRTLSFTSLTAGRYEMRVTRMDTKSTDFRTYHSIQLAGVKAWLNAPSGYDSTYGQTTKMWMVMRASEQLSGLAARKISVLATRKLPIWSGTSWSSPTATSSIAWAAANLLRSSYGGNMADSKIDLSGLLALNAVWTARGDRFDAVFDTRITLWEALGKVCTAGRARPYRQAGKVRVARDGLDTTPVAMFTPANIKAGSFSIQYIMPSDRTAEEVRVRYTSALTWKPAEAVYTLASADPDKKAEIDLFGVTQPSQAADHARYIAQTNRLRRKVLTFDTELDALILSPLDLVAVSHDLPNWGQHARANAWSASTLTLTLDRELTWTPSATHYARVRGADGTPSAAIAVTQGAANQIIFASDPGAAVLDLADGFEVHVSFGAGTAWQVTAKVLTVTPKDEFTSTIALMVEDVNVHTGC